MTINEPVPTAHSTRKATSRHARPVRLRRTVFHLSCLELVGSELASSRAATVVAAPDRPGLEALRGTTACRRARTVAPRTAGRRGTESGRALEVRGSECWVALAPPG